MALVAAKCTNCGANLDVDAANDAAICTYCGAAFVVEKAINNYNIANAQISAETVNVNIGGGDFVIEGGVLKEYKGNDAYVIIPNNVVKIADLAFNDCECVTKVTIPASVKTLCAGAFGGCRNLSELVFTGSLKIVRSTRDTALELPENYLPSNNDGESVLFILGIMGILSATPDDSRSPVVNGVDLSPALLDYRAAKRLEVIRRNKKALKKIAPELLREI